MPIQLRPFRRDEADYQALATIHNSVWGEYPQSPAELRYYDDQRPARLAQVRLIAEGDGQPIASAFAGNAPWMYHPHKFFIDVTVHAAYHQQGIGTQIYDALLTELMPYNPILLRTQVREDRSAAMAFALRHGFVEEKRYWESRLTMADFDPTPFLAAAARAEASGITICTARKLSEHDPDFWAKLHAFDTVVSVDVPMPEPYTPSPLEEWLAFFRGNPNFIPEAYFVACDGAQIVGVSALWRRANTPNLDTGFTAVLRSHRRRGIALALKLRALDYARQVGAPMVRTDNASDNQGMLAINVALGFVRQPAWVGMVAQSQAVGGLA